MDEVERTSIERWRAVRLIEIKENGRTRPLDVSCEPEDAEENEESNTTQRRYVVKTLGAEVTEQSLFNELFGGMLAGLLGVPSPPPAIILIDQEFIAAHELVLRRAEREVLVGLAIGSRHLEPLHSVTVDSMFTTPPMIEQAARLFALDMLIQNPDRRRSKPNCAFHQKNLTAFDFELGFSFLQLLPSMATFFPPDKVDEKMARDHVLFEALRRKTAIFGGFLKDLEGLSDGIMEEWVRATPGSWQRNASRITDHIRQVREHAPAFGRSLEMVLQG